MQATKCTAEVTPSLFRFTDTDDDWSDVLVGSAAQLNRESNELDAQCQALLTCQPLIIT